MTRNFADITIRLVKEPPPERLRGYPVSKGLPYPLGRKSGFKEHPFDV